MSDAMFDEVVRLSNLMWRRCRQPAEARFREILETAAMADLHRLLFLTYVGNGSIRLSKAESQMRGIRVRFATRQEAFYTLWEKRDMLGAYLPDALDRLGRRGGVVPQL